MFTTTTIRLLCSMLAVSMLGSVVGQDSDSFSEQAGRESPMDDNSKAERNVGVTDPPVQLCGRIKVPIPGSGGRKKRFSSIEDWDDLDKFADSPFATYGEIPWMVKILDNGTFVCGGAIINDYWVVTGASCVTNDEDSTGPYTLVVGDYSLSSDDPGEQTFEISLIAPTSYYNAQSGAYNIALLRVKPNCNHGILFNNYVQPVCLPLFEETLADRQNLTLAAWTTSPSATAPPHFLRKGTTRVINRHSCSWCLETGLQTADLTQDILCAGGVLDETVVDNQSIGGPATSRHGDIHVLRGIIHSRSRPGVGRSCDLKTYLTSIHNHLTWIEPIIYYNSPDGQNIIPPRTA